MNVIHPGHFDRLRRWARRVNPFASRSDVQWVYSDRYAIDLAWPMADPKRGQRVLSFLDEEGLLRRGDLHRTRRASVRKLRLVHGDEYLRQLEESEGLSRVIGMPVPPGREDELLLAQRAMVGGTVVAARLALDEDRVLVNLGGGLHHAMPDRGQGFCLFHDVAIAIRHQRARDFRKPILVIDLDLHDGDGTRVIFADDPTVYTYSVHNRHLVDPEAEASTAIELGTDVEDELYLRTVRETLPEVIARVRPGLVFYLAGTDPAHDDRMGDWKISEEGMLARDRFVMEQVRGKHGPVPVVITLAGGYGHHAWRYSARFLSALARGGEALDPPATSGLPVTAYRRLARHLSVPEADDASDDDWSLSQEDLPGVAPPHRSRFLDRWSVHAVELGLERAGLLDRVRSQGYEHLKLEANLDHPAGQTLRLLNLQPTRQVLIELRVRRDRSVVPSFEVLFVEWLLSQNPAAEFPAHRPELPGQEHPGMGLLPDIASMLVVTAEALDLDGVAFVPSHFALALQSAPHVRFVDPERGSRFEAVLAALGDRPFLQKVRCVEEGRVRRADTDEPYAWEPTAMVLPTSGVLKGWFRSIEYRDRWSQARDAVEWRIVEK